MSKTAQNFTEGRIFSPLIKFALPVLFALFLQTMYGAVDLMVVGQFSTAADVSAVATGSQLMMTVTVVITGLAMGLTVLVGRKIGAGKSQEAGKIIGSGIFLFGIVGLVLTIGMVSCSDILAGLLHAPEEAFSRTVTYITVCSAGAIFIVAYNLLGSIFRGIGDSKMPLITVAIACALNIAGDLLLVAVFRMGTLGAAIATIFAQAVSVALSLIIIKKRKLPFEFHFKKTQYLYKRNSQTWNTYCSSGASCKHFVSCYYGYRKQPWSYRICRCWCCGKNVRIFNACSLKLYAVNVSICGAKYGRSKT